MEILIWALLIITGYSIIGRLIYLYNSIEYLDYDERTNLSIISVFWIISFPIILFIKIINRISLYIFTKFKGE